MGHYHTTYRGAHIFKSGNLNGLQDFIYTAHCCGEHFEGSTLEDVQRKVDILVPDTKPVSRDTVYEFPILPRRPIVA